MTRGITPLELFEKRCEAVANALAQNVPVGIPDNVSTNTGTRNKTFFEAYWSNQIEGSTLTIGEAQQVATIEEYQPRTEGKQKDALDLRGTITAASDSRWSNINPTHIDRWRTTLLQRHQLMMAHRPEKLPGQWRDDDVMVGEKTFMPPGYVEPALRTGHTWIMHCNPGLSRAIMTMWMTVDIHPFRDGNGRSSRMAMNAELSGLELTRLVVAKNLREDMLAGLSRMSNRRKPDKLIQAMLDIQDWTLSIGWHDLDTTLAQLRSQGLTDGTELSAEELRILQNGTDE